MGELVESRASVGSPVVSCLQADLFHANFQRPLFH